MIFKVGSSSKMPGIDQPRHAGRGLVRPAEAEPDLVLRRLLAGVVGKIAGRASDAPRPAGRARPSAGRSAGYSGALDSGLPATLVNTWMPRAPSCVIARSISVRRRLDIVHRQRRDERRKPIGMAAADLRQRIVRDPRQLRRLVGRCHQLERRIGERRSPAAGRRTRSSRRRRASTSTSGFKRGKPVHRDMAGRKLRQPVEIGLRHEMIEDVDHHAPSRRAKLGHSSIADRNGNYIMRP